MTGLPNFRTSGLHQFGYTLFIMMRKVIFVIFLFIMPLMAAAQINDPNHINPEDRDVDMDDPTFIPMVKVGKVLVNRTPYSMWSSTTYGCTPNLSSRTTDSAWLTTASSTTSRKCCPSPRK